jgi:hypothetical protein
MKRYIAMALGLLLLAAPGAFAQISTGNIYGTVVDAQGGVLPGATVTLSGDFGTRTVVTTAGGEFRFLSLDSGRYKLTVSLAGFASIAREVVVTSGENVNLPFTMKVAGVQETVEVLGETPLVDVKKRGTSTTMVTDELQKVPNARDPWGVLKNVPGVLLDRMNIAGNENGQQANAGAKGTIEGDKSWSIDGLVVTDMTATGGSPSYFDFDAFQEIAVTTGGADLQTASPGIGINLVTKRGTNRLHGGGRGFLTPHQMESSNLPSALVGDPRLENPDGSFRDQADHIQQINDYGFDLGGPIIKDRLWFYGSWGKQDIRLVRLTGTDDKTQLKSYNVKLNWQATRNTMVSGFFFDGIKAKTGRSPGSGLNEPSTFLWDQGNAYQENRPHGLWKVEVNQTFSPNFFVSAKAAYYNTGFGLFSRDENQSYTYDYVAGQTVGAYYDYFPVRPQKTLDLGGNYFFQGMGGSHELKFGFGYREVTTSTNFHWTGNQLVGYINSATDYEARLYREGAPGAEGKYMDFYAGDVFTKDRLSVNVGVRWDNQKAKNTPASAPANASFPDILPGLTYGGDTDYPINWKNISPRVGLSYALDDARKTVARASYARYYSQLQFTWVQDENPVTPGYLSYGWNDANGDRLVQPDEVLFNDFRGANGIDPNNPTSAGSTPDRIDRDLKAPHTDEFIVGVDHELMPNFAVGAAYTYRRNGDLTYRPHIAAACPANPTAGNCPIIQPNLYTPNDPVSSGGYTVFTYSPPDDLVEAGSFGRLRTNQPGYVQNFNGLDLTMTKRLSNKWMGRIAFSWNAFKQNYSGVTPVNGGGGTQGGIGGPGGGRYNGNPTPTDLNSLTNDYVAAQSGGSGRATFYTTPTWQIYANALYQLPWNLEASGAIFGRQGQIEPLYIKASAGADGSFNVLATPTVDAVRYSGVWDLDLRLAKNVKLSESAAITLSIEGFNIFNSGTTLQQFRQVNSDSFQRIDEILSPRIFRLGARLTF